MNYGRAFLAGMVGGAVMSLIMAIGRAMGMQVNLEMMEGTMLGLQPGETTWIIGFVMHLVISGLLGLLYAVGFEYMAGHSGWKIGIAFSIIHIIVAGILMGMVPMVHPMVPERLPAPGFFMSKMGLGAMIAFVMLHVIFGAIVGALYTPVRGFVRKEAVAG